MLSGVPADTSTSGSGSTSDDDGRSQRATASPNASTSADQHVGVTAHTRRALRGPQQSVCVSCRKAKLRCDRKAPCVHCERQGVQCLYPSIEPRRNVGTASSIRTRKGKAKGDACGAFSSSSSSADAPATSALAKQPMLGSWSEQPGWRDHLLSLFPGTRLQAQRRIVKLLRMVPQMIYRDHFFHLVHMAAPIRAIVQATPPQDVHPALVYALIAYALRMLRRASADVRPGLIPRESVPTPAYANDVALRLQREAEVMLAQSLSDVSVDAHNSLSLGQAAAMLMKLQPELTPSFDHYRTIAETVAGSPEFCAYVDSTAALPFCSTPQATNTAPDGDAFPCRSSIRIEEAARLRLISIWAGMPYGINYPNLELFDGKFRLESIEAASIYMPFIDEADAAKKEVQQAAAAAAAAAAGRRRIHSAATASGRRDGGTSAGKGDVLRHDLGCEDTTGFLQSVTSRLQMFRLLSRCGTVWQVAQLDYNAPTNDFAALLDMMDWYDESNRRMQHAMATSRVAVPFASKQRFAKRIIGTAFLQGFLIRRIGIAHCASLRRHVAKAMQNKSGEANGAACNSSGEASATVHPAWQDDFDSPTLLSWLDVMHLFAQELQDDYVATTREGNGNDGTLVAPPLLSSFSLDSVLLYAAASEQYGHGVANVYRLLSHPCPEQQSLARGLFDVARHLRKQVLRHRGLHEQCARPNGRAAAAALIDNVH